MSSALEEVKAPLLPPISSPTSSSSSSSPSSPNPNPPDSIATTTALTTLLSYSDLPPWRRDNAYLLTSYRPTSKSYILSLLSLFHLHNETINIWTHLLGSLASLFISIYLYTTLLSPRYPTATTADVVVFGCFLIGAYVCLGMSATYHALCNHSPAVAKWGNKLDYTGIVCLIVGSYVPALYYGLRGREGVMRMYMATVFVSGISCLVVSWIEKLRTPEWRPYRTLMFVMLGLSGVGPVVEGLLAEGFAYHHEKMGLGWVMLQGLLYLIGAFIYVFRWPERVWPRTFDVWGSSHQIFHVLILMAAASHLYGMLKAFDYRHGHLS